MTRAFLPLSVLAILSFAACSGEPPDPSRLSLQKHGAAADHFLLRSVERVREAWALFRNELRLTGAAAQNEVENRLQDKAREAIHDAVSGAVFPAYEEDRDMEAELDLEDAAPAPQAPLPSQDPRPNRLQPPSGARNQEAFGAHPAPAPISQNPMDARPSAAGGGRRQWPDSGDGGPSPWEPAGPPQETARTHQTPSADPAPSRRSAAPSAPADEAWRPTPPAFAKDWQ